MTVSWYARPAARAWACAAAPSDVADFHADLPGYRPTPLTEVPALAGELGVDRLFVKDESFRLGLGAFKVLGASWAIHRALARRGGGPVELVAATDGNHGRAVARTARLLGLPAHVYVPDVVPIPAVEAIAAEGAEITIVTGSYDDAVGRAATAADRDGAELIQDTAWPGYDEIPRWIVDGYATLFTEIDTQLAEAGAEPVGLVAVPMGVGSLAQATVIHHRSRRGNATVLGVEPDSAACVLTSLAHGELRTIPTGTTIMAGLNCGTPSSLAWPYLRDGMDAAVAVADSDASTAVRDLAAVGISSGPSGAASLAGARAALTGDPDRRVQLSTGHFQTVVLLSTEGAAT